ncbi:hypothetical protein LCGC14_1121780 [marine sediment metagenome]|uniref:Uncharacterized protein n=1 Tax=marine sediment metagenome TaxID=412755 RepID=A0A0F9MRJ2_9ZZZZ|nr:hypothetical protein [archaeon]HEC41013.1 hypothetical protein [bacterium]
MHIKPTVKIDPDDMVRYLLYQQFYYGEDNIYGRTKDLYEHIEGAGNAIEDFYSLISKPIDLIDMEQADKYLEFFNEKIFQIPKKTILDKFKEYKDNLGTDMSRGIILTVIVGESLMEVHDKCFNATIIQLIEFIMKNRSLEADQKAEIERRIKVLYGKSNIFIGMIYSLSFMEFIGKKVQNQNIINNCRNLLEKYYGLILNLIVN